ncbi:MAG: hypothetical protein IPF82_11555 [Blastocatellia bacterium]|nr:hypothetical protein [Blastocatellia bacterium]
MGVVGEGLSPGVQDGEQADACAEAFGIRGDRDEGLGGGGKEDAVDDALVLEGEVGDLFRESEDDVEVMSGEQVGRAGLDPPDALERLAPGAVAVGAAVVGVATVAAGIAGFDVTAEGGRPAVSDHVMTRRCTGRSQAPKRARN